MARTEATTTQRGSRTPSKPDALDSLLRAWQADGREQTLESLVRIAAPIVEHAARRELRGFGIRDPAAADDAVARVFDHLRRLHGTAAGERRVTGFGAGAPHAGHASALTFIRLLARSRARDVARSRRRAGRHERPFATLDDAARDHVHAVAATDGDDDPVTDLKPRLLAAIAALDGRERMAISLRLEGKSLAVVAHALDVCEGTASRIHARAVATLRAALRPR